MFSNLHGQAVVRLRSLIESLADVVPVNQSTFEFNICEALDAHEILLNKTKALFKKDIPYIYCLSVTNTKNLDRVCDCFAAAKAQEINDRAYCKLNSTRSCCFYVGSSYDLQKRFKEHLGYGAKSTYALQLKHWAEKLSLLRLRLDYAEYSKEADKEIIQTLEDALWDIQEPMFGRKGSK